MKYKYHSAKGSKTAWIESPNGDEVGNLIEITEELNLLQRSWIEKCMEADTLRQHLRVLDAICLRDITQMEKSTPPCKN